MIFSSFPQEKTRVRRKPTNIKKNGGPRSGVSKFSPSIDNYHDALKDTTVGIKSVVFV
jgi:hypothetical protein